MMMKNIYIGWKADSPSTAITKSSLRTVLVQCHPSATPGHIDDHQDDNDDHSDDYDDNDNKEFVENCAGLVYLCLHSCVITIFYHDHHHDLC